MGAGLRPGRGAWRGLGLVFGGTGRSELMGAFGASLEHAVVAPELTPEAAFHAHFKLTAIHPFSGGNGRTACLLMNLLLIRGGYVPIAARPKDRATYLDALEPDQLGMI